MSSLSTDLEGGLESARIIWLSLLLGQVFSVALGLYFIPAPAEPPSYIILGFLGYLGLMLLICSHHFRYACSVMRKPKSRAVDRNRETRWAAGKRVPPHLVVGPAYTEIVVFLGLVVRALGYSLAITLVFCGAGFIALGLQFPRVRDFDAMVDEPHVA
jgi:hypothetical protein